MIGPRGGGSKEFDATLSLIELIQNPEKYKDKLKELSETILDADKRKTESQSLQEEANRRMKDAVTAEGKYLTMKAKFDAEMEDKENSLKDKMSLLGQDVKGLNEFRDEMDKFKKSLEEKESKLNARDVSLNKKQAELEEIQSKLISEASEIERKKAILAKL